MVIKNRDSSIHHLHLDLSGDNSGENLKELSKKLEGKIRSSEISDKISLTNEHEYIAKFAELMGHNLEFQITHADPNHNPANSVLIANELLDRLDEAEVGQQSNKTIVGFPNRATIEYGREGIISDSSNENLIGKDCLRYIACNVHEDFGVIFSDKGRFAYVFDSAMFEKTPKDIHTGENKFMGRDFFEFHSKGKNFGHILPGIFANMMRAFKDEKLDMLSIDLRGANIYTDGNIEIRRFERDYVVPIRQPDFRGILVYTDVFFHDVREKRSPFNGGKHLEIESPVEFASTFKVKQDGT